RFSCNRRLCAGFRQISGSARIVCNQLAWVGEDNEGACHRVVPSEDWVRTGSLASMRWPGIGRSVFLADIVTSADEWGGDRDLMTGWPGVERQGVLAALTGVAGQKEKGGKIHAYEYRDSTCGRRGGHC